MKLPQEIDRLAEYLHTPVSLLDFTVDGSKLVINAFTVDRSGSASWENVQNFVNPNKINVMNVSQEYLQIEALNNILVRRLGDHLSLFDLMRAVGSKYPDKIYKRTSIRYELGLFLGNPNPTPLVTIDQWLDFVPRFRQEYPPMNQSRVDAINTALGVIDHDSLPSIRIPKGLLKEAIAECSQKKKAIPPIVETPTTEKKMSQNVSLIIPELDNASIRIKENGDVSVFDFIGAVGKQKNPRKAWNLLSASYPEVVEFCYNFKFAGAGQRETPVINRQGLAELMMVLPGALGAKFRRDAARIVLRYLDADITLADEVVDRNIEKGKVEDVTHHAIRTQGKVARTQLMGECAKRGVHGQGFADVTNAGYVGLFGLDAKGLRKERDLPVKANIREHLGSDELTDVLFLERLAKKRLADENAKGNEQCTSVVYLAAQTVAELVY